MPNEKPTKFINLISTQDSDLIQTILIEVFLFAKAGLLKLNEKRLDLRA